LLPQRAATDELSFRGKPLPAFSEGTFADGSAFGSVEIVSGFEGLGFIR
jgi:hypothetical protein